MLRKIKAKLLTRGIVTINGAHLIQPELADFLRRNPCLLTGKLLLPAMREDRHSFTEYAADHEPEYLANGWDRGAIQSAAAFVDQHVQEVLPWRVEQASGDYRDRLLHGLANPSSAIRHKLIGDRRASPEELDAFVENLKDVDSSEERAIGNAVAAAPFGWQAALRDYTHACYHLVGARVVNCEAGLDVTSLSELRMAEFLQDDGGLTDDAVCLRLLLEAAIEAINSTTLPDLLLDSIALNDLASVRAALREQGFQAKYDELLDGFFRSMQEPGGNGLDVLDVSSVVSMSQHLSTHFHAYCEAELATYRTRTQLEQAAALQRGSISTVKSILGVLPGIGTVVGLTDAIGSSVALGKEAIDLATAYGYREVAAGDARAARERQLEIILQRIGSSRKSVILSAVRELHSLAALNMWAP